MNLNDNPTTDQLGKLLQACPDTGPYVVWVDHLGEVQIALLTQDMPVQVMGESVEAESAHDSLYIATLFDKLMETWKETAS